MNQVTKLRLMTALAAGGLSLTCLEGCSPASDHAPAEVNTDVAVQVASVCRTNLHAVITAFGLVEPEPAGGGLPAGQAQLATPDPGVVLEVTVREGQTVKAGDLIVRLDDRIAQAEVDKAKHALEFAEAQLARTEKLRATEATSEKAYQAARQQLEAAQADLAAAQGRLARVQLRSPLAGVVTRVRVQPGQAVDAGTILVSILDPKRLVATAHVPLAEAARLHVGQPVEWDPDAHADPPAEGKVTFVSPDADPTTGAVLVRVSLPAATHAQAGQWLRFRIITDTHARCLAVPRAAVYTDPQGQSTVVLVNENVAHRVPVNLGLTEGDWVEISGDTITEGRMVVTRGSYALPEGTHVHVVEP